MAALPDPHRIDGTAHANAHVGMRSDAHGDVPWLLDMLGMTAVAGGALVGALLLVHSPFDGPWRLVLSVAVVFAGIYAGFLMMGFASNLRELAAVRRCLALVAHRRDHPKP